jgi:nitrile hydratase subunit beta
MTEPPFRGYHDIGGLPGGPIARVERDFEDWQKLSEAIRNALDQKHKMVSLDELRRAFESFGKELYQSLGFYERRAEALAVLLDEKGVISRADLLARMDAIAAARGQVVDHTTRQVMP